MIVNSDIRIDKGCTFILPMALTSGGIPFDLTDWTLSGQVRKTYVTDVVAEFSFDITNPTGGEVTAMIDAIYTADIDTGETEVDGWCQYVYDITASHSGVVRRIKRGIAFIRPDVTR